MGNGSSIDKKKAHYGTYVAHGIYYLPTKSKGSGSRCYTRGKQRARKASTANGDLLKNDTGETDCYVPTNKKGVPSIGDKGSIISCEFDICEDISCHGEEYTPGIIEQVTGKALMVSQDWTENVQNQLLVKNSGDSNHLQWIHARNMYPFENLVLSGGGSKGYSYLGALKALEDAGLLSQIKKIAGSSAGAICGALVAVGCSSQDIANLFLGDIKWLFQDQICACCCCLPKICQQYGVHPAKRFLNIYGQHIAAKVGNPDITFKQLYDLHDRELCIVVTNVSKMCSEYCHPSTTPDLPIRMAVRMSMSFPMVYQAVRVEINGQTSLYTDGGTLDQYPVHCFDGDELDLNQNTSELENGFNEKTLGMYLVSENAIDYKIWKALFDCDIPNKPTYIPDTKIARLRLQQEYEKRKRKSPELTFKEFISELQKTEHTDQPMFHYETCNRSMVDIRNFKDYFVTTVETLLINQRRLHVKPNDNRRTIAINCGYISTSDYDLEPGDREFMIRQGYICTRRFLEDYIAAKPTKCHHLKEDSGLTLCSLVSTAVVDVPYIDDETSPSDS